MQTPYHFRALDMVRGAPPKAPTPQMFNGTLVHCALLEPAEFGQRYEVIPATDKRTKDYRDAAKRCETEGREPITELQRQQAFAQAAALAALPEVAELLRAGQPEVSAYWADPATGALCKCRPDWVSPVGYGKGAVLLDVKTTGDASEDAFARSVHSFGYHTQADFYCTGYALASGVQVHGMLFAVVESDYPHAAEGGFLARLRARYHGNRLAPVGEGLTWKKPNKPRLSQ
jgi:hypothetical protein